MRAREDGTEVAGARLRYSGPLGHDRRFEVVRVDHDLGSTSRAERLNFQGSPYLSSLSCPTQVSRADTVGTEVIISLQGLVGGMRFLTQLLANHSS